MIELFNCLIYYSVSMQANETLANINSDTITQVEIFMLIIKGRT
tara:strand:- start:1451 stop:1582 length:132 start_codon:yes stop_codon:yes gene_type:complete